MDWLCVQWRARCLLLPASRRRLSEAAGTTRAQPPPSSPPRRPDCNHPSWTPRALCPSSAAGKELLAAGVAGLVADVEAVLPYFSGLATSAE